ncbi:LPXTG cell wall anchor domain-containing protein [Lactobacillus crispatus]|uniref:LPXTG cell wall anchor domain-containing protein n=1 Tax=Lactobacillus crispatus TaxID=47770 RepID=UPI0027BA582E|nr:LPXTG cell wall anchor domain-containing protein [Lactobacillus crispatus]
MIKNNINKGTPVSLVNNKKNQSKNRDTLPQTGEKKESSISVLGVLLLALGSLTSWLTFRKKRKN